MLLINNTDEDMVLHQLRAKHGKIVGIFKASAALDNPRAMIPKKMPPIVNPKTGKVALPGAICAGFFCAKKDDNALVGTEGAMAFTPTKRFPVGITVGWEVPLTSLTGSYNCLFISASQFSGNIDRLINAMEHCNILHMKTGSSGGGMVFAEMNDPHGRERYMLVSIGPVASERDIYMKTKTNPTDKPSPRNGSMASL